MEEKEKLAFLKRMGLPVGRLGKSDEDIRKRNKTDTRVDKSDLIALARMFDVTPTKKPIQTLDEFLKEKEDGKGDIVD